MKTVHWYFDVISLFAYLQSEQFGQIKSLAKMVYKTVLFAGLLNHFDNVGLAKLPNGLQRQRPTKTS